MNPKVEFLKNIISKLASYIGKILLIIYTYCYMFMLIFGSVGILFYAIDSIDEVIENGIIKFIWFYFFEFSILILPCSFFYFLFTHKNGKIRKSIFYGFSITILSIYLFSFFFPEYHKTYRIMYVFGLFIQPFLTIYLFYTKEKIEKDVLFLYIIPVNISSVTLLYFELVDNSGF